MAGSRAGDRARFGRWGRRIRAYTPADSRRRLLAVRRLIPGRLREYCDGWQPRPCDATDLLWLYLRPPDAQRAGALPGDHDGKPAHADGYALRNGGRTAL